MMMSNNKLNIRILLGAQICSIILTFGALVTFMIGHEGSILIYGVVGIITAYGFSILLQPNRRKKGHALIPILMELSQQKQNQPTLWAVTLCKNTYWQSWAICLIASLLINPLPKEISYIKAPLIISSILMFILFYGLGTYKIYIRRAQIALQITLIAILLATPWHVVNIQNLTLPFVLSAFLWSASWVSILSYYLIRLKKFAPQRRVFKLVGASILATYIGLTAQIMQGGFYLVILVLIAYIAFLAGTFHRSKKRLYLGL